jgi:hypothetical protein
MFPASMAEVIAVGAVDPSTKGLWDRTNPVDYYVDGVDRVSIHVGWSDDRHVPTANAWAKWSGTSFAAPVVAARLAARPDSAGALAQLKPGQKRQ